MSPPTETTTRGEAHLPDPVVADQLGGPTAPPARVERWRPSLARPGPVAAVLGCYVLAAFLVPTLAPVSIIDDWVYARAVQRLVQDGQLYLPELSAANLLFQVLWGGLFSSLFGMTLGVLRLSTVVITLLGGWGMYGLCRELGVSPDRSALGAAAYLFNPLSFVLSFSFMTDPYFTSLLTIAGFFFVRGVRRGDNGTAATVAGSVVASLAFLVRQQGLLIPLGVLTYLLAARRVTLDRAGLRPALPVVAVPAATFVAFELWLVLVNGVPGAQQGFAGEVGAAGASGTALLFGRMAFIELMYVGLFVLPVAVAVAPVVGRLLADLGTRGRTGLAAVTSVLVVGLVAFTPERLMPYVPQFVSRFGIGSYDLSTAPAPVVPRAVLFVLTAACAVAALVVAAALLRAAFTRHPGALATGAGLVACLAAWQVVGSLMPSFHFADWRAPGPTGRMVSSPSLDRYILPLLPLAVALGLWAVRDLRLRMAAAWATVTALGLVAVAGTHDSLVVQDETWKMARAATADGVPRTKLDAGAAWTGYTANRDVMMTEADDLAGRVWYLNLWAPDVDPEWVISPEVLDGHQVVESRRYSTWLPRSGSTLYLLRRGEAGSV